MCLKTPEDIADLLEVSYRDLNYWIYRTPEARRYRTFFIQKKNGGQREINAPTVNVKILQQKLNEVLQAVYQMKPSVHGFVSQRSVKSNALRHVARRWVFNVDLEDFFPSINFGRVRGMFMGKPYHLPVKVATVLAHICCFEGRIPQGSPTSPVVSNMICAQMDSQLQRLAERNHSTYTRYADDISFSTTRRTFPPELAARDSLDQLSVGNAVREIIERNGFSINSQKIWLTGRHGRQVVTGVTVNDVPNVQRKFTNQIRAMIHAWKRYGPDAAQEEWEKKHSGRDRAPWRKAPRFGQVLRGKIEYLGMIKGQDSLTYLKFLDQLGELDPGLTGGKGTPLGKLLRSFDSLGDSEISPQNRGYQFEKLIGALFYLSRVKVSEGFKRNLGAEQIDGAFELDGWYYLVECKWQSDKTSPSDVDGLKAKIGRSGHQAMGVFISVNGWSSHVVELLKQDPSKRLLLMNGDDIRAVLHQEISLVDLLRAKIGALNLKSEPYLGVHDAIANLSSQAE